MLKLDNIKKNYYVADMTVEALKGINLCFRKSEFVSILGPSGCGKTTLLNIIGGLDQYTSGDLVIAGRSTKEFKDHDWDVYRNHRIGFIFQSYNLIPHQTVLGNVELALTIAGLPKAERIARAKRALDKVGLSNQYYKKPNQMSGGQCQRVAIARALVNEPEILLADEPTGALDTETSVQIMDLIQEIAKEKLVIMVTHNPDLAYKYSTRIVKCLDGRVQEDSNPFTVEDEAKEMEEYKKEKEEAKEEVTPKKKDSQERAKMSLWTAFKLSARNLQAKFKRTFMVALAGCIGIVGVSTVLAVSNGVQNYIKDMENDMLSGNPVYITSSSLDYSSIMGGELSSNQDPINEEKDRSQIFINSLVQTLVNMNGVTATNEIGKDYMEFLSKMPEDACAIIQYLYGDKIAPNIYVDFETKNGVRTMSVAAIQAYYASVLSNVEEFAQYSSMINSVSVMSEMPSDAKYIADQYEIVYMEPGYTLEEVLSSKESLVAVASKNSNTLNDLELAEYGYFSQEQFLNYCYKVGDSELYNPNSLDNMGKTMSYKELCDKKFTWYPNNTVYTQGTTSDTTGEKWYASAYADNNNSGKTDFASSNYARNASDFTNADGKVELNVKCVLRLKDSLSYGCLSSGGLYYTNALTNHMRDYNLDSEIVKSARDNGGALYNVEIGYEFQFDDTTSTTVESHYLSQGSSAIMDYIAQFMGGSSGASKLSSYSEAALGGNKYPTTVYFYCNNFEQKDLLTNYLDIWNDKTQTDLYKVDTNGFYVGKTEDAEGNSITTYYYKHEPTGKYYKVNISDDGYATDFRGNVYKLITDEETGKSKFYIKLDDTIGEKFTIDGTIKINDSISINAYSLASYVVFKDEFTSNNIYYKDLELVPNKGDYLYRYLTADGEYQYVMKVQNQSFYKVRLDRNGNLISQKNGYKTYEYVEEDNKFFEVNYVKTEDMYIQNTETINQTAYDALGVTNPEELAKYSPVTKYYKNTSTTATQIWEEIEKDEYDTIADDANQRKSVTTYEKNTYTFQEGSYVAQKTEVQDYAMSNLYIEDSPYNYPNVVKNPTFTVQDVEWTFDTRGFYINLTDITSKLTDYNTLSTNFTFDTDNHIVTLKDYSGIDFYYRDLDDMDSKYYRVKYEEEDGVSYIKGQDLSSYISSAGLDGIDLGSYISDTYIINDDGSLQAVSENFDTTAISSSQLLELRIVGDELTDLSILEADDSKQVKYTDMIGLIINMVNTLINVITYALIAFTALSLVVSTVMIGIITYVSVVERTKEIGVIRALGGRKKDVSHLFNAETLIIGFSAGALGIAITYGLSGIINLIIGHYSGIYTIAALPWYQAIIMIGVSIFLTLISGLIPASSAAKKDPVIALRTE